MTFLNPASMQYGHLIRAVADRLIAATIDETVPHAELRRVAAEAGGRPAYYYSYVGRARELLSAECGAVFRCDPREGYRRLASAPGLRYAGDVGLKRTRSAARRGMKFAGNALVHANELSAEERRLANSRLCALGLVEHLTRRRTIEHLPGEEPREDALAGLRRVLGVSR